MSEYTRYLLASAGIEATEQQIEAIDASGHPYEVCSLLARFAWDAAKAKQAMDVLQACLENERQKHVHLA